MISWIDVRLGLRMLVKHPALTLVGGFGMAVAIAISVGFFSFTAAYIYPTIPLEAGDRIVALENRDLEVNNEERQSLHDFFTWREELESVDDLGAFRTIERNLITGDGPPELVPVAEMTAAGFDVARVPPLRGRYLVPDDERAGAPPVVVIGYDVWQNRFNGTDDIIGREIRFGSLVHTIVGVMPEDFAFPESHEFWTPLRATPSQYERRAGPSIYIFGRLAPGVTMAQAQAELDAIGQRTSSEFPLTHAQLRPMVMPYVHSLGDIQGTTFLEVFQMNAMMTLLLVVIALNVAVLVYARTAARHGEIAVRSALGASRARVVLQLFVEALMLALVSAAAGLAIAQIGIALGNGITQLEFNVGTPFWWDFSIQPLTVLFTVGLALFAAVIVGVLPALQATGRRLQSDLRHLGGGTNLRLGKTWTALIVVQIAIAVAALPAAVNMGWDAIRMAATRATYPAEEYLAVALAPEAPITPAAGRAGSGADAAGGADSVGGVDSVGGAEAADVAAAAARRARFTRNVDEVMRRLQAEPSVAGVSYRANLPGRDDMIRVEGIPAPVETPSGHPVDAVGVSPGYYALFDAQLLRGRAFEPADLADNATAVIVDETFVERVMGGGDALGRRIRHVSDEERAGEDLTTPVQWYEIVGVVEELQRNEMDPERLWPTVAYPVATEQLQYATLAVRLRGTTPADFAPHMRELAADVDPTLRLGTIRSLADSNRQEELAARLIGLAVGLVLLTVLLLSAAGIYAMMSFAVTQRRREIGIRSALGANPAQVLRSIFARAVVQIGAGIAIGVATAAWLEWSTDGQLMGGTGVVVLPVLAVLMMITGLLAALGPARRGLSIQPTEALKGE